MRILVSKYVEGRADVLFVPRRDSGKAPVMLQNVTPEELSKRVESTYREVLGLVPVPPGDA